jgi:hypothetical protein
MKEELHDIDGDFLFCVIRDLERALNRRGIYAEIDPGAVPHEVRVAWDMMQTGAVGKAKKMAKQIAREVIDGGAKE